ncbi:MAG: hypothetical protein KY445_12865 [Armatimonadetes bacterium]|nr:hypothetical protein [Armatimonadota bacterium]
MPMQTMPKPLFKTPNLLQIAMPMGGLGAGCVCLNGYGGLQDFSIRHRPHNSALPDTHRPTHAAFAVLHLKNGPAKLLEGPIPIEKIYNQGLKAQGFRQGQYEGIPRFANAEFENGFPFGHVRLHHDDVPLNVEITGWNPFIPLDDISSGLPCAMLEYKFENRSSKTVEFEFSTHLSHLAAPLKVTTFNAILPATAGQGGGIHFWNDLPPHDEDFGTAALYSLSPDPKIKAMWFRGGWFDAMSVLWRELSSGTFRENNGDLESEPDARNGGSILHAATLEAGQSITFPIAICWHFPNSRQSYGLDAACASACDCAPTWRPFYAGQWKDAGQVAQHVAENYAVLREKTHRFADALWDSTLPAPVLDAIASNLAILKSPTVLRLENGNVWGWEGCFTDAGCCSGTCTHVWNYAQAMPHLFPALERTLREQELLRSRDERGHVNFRAALPDGSPPHSYHAAADGQLGGILKLWRDFHICGDEKWLQSLFFAAKSSLDFCIETWDPQRCGALFEPHHNTYDIEFWGPDGMCGTIYIGALAAFADLARELGHDGAPYEELARRGAQFLDEQLWNGEFYAQKVQWEGLRDTSFAQKMAEVDESSAETLKLQKAEGPKYQYGTGCLSDGVIGAWMAQIYGIEAPFNRGRIRENLRAIFTHNFKNDLSDHVCTQRPGYAHGSEAGLLLCTWPRGEKPTLPFVYSDEVWTGIEYQVASHLIEEGLVEQGLAIVSAVRARYDGRVRNPFNEYECGSYYARAMASYALLNSLSGFRYDAVSQTLFFGPKVEVKGEFRTFFCVASGYGTLALRGDELEIELIDGELVVKRAILTLGGESRDITWHLRDK